MRIIQAWLVALGALKKAPSRQQDQYVITYDLKDPTNENFDEGDERYYGFFATPEEAQEIWREFSKNRNFYTVRLCKVVGRLSDGN
jgi:hypothetical protein